MKIILSPGVSPAMCGYWAPFASIRRRDDGFVEVIPADPNPEMTERVLTAADASARRDWRRKPPLMEQNVLTATPPWETE